MTDTGRGAPGGLRSANRERLVRLLRERGPMTQAELARASGLSPATVSTITRELRERGRLAAPDGGPGRGERLQLDARAGVVVGIDFGHTHVRVAVADLAHTVLGEAEEAVDVDHDADDGMDVAAAMVGRLLDDAGVRRDRVAGVGMGVPGPLRADSGRIGDSAVLPGWVGARPEAAMRDRLGLPVRVDNDANLGALAELVWGAGRGRRDVLYVKVASGVGAGIVIGGRLHRGMSGTAGEIGHLTIEPQGAVCRCGNRGCLETLAGADAVVAPLRRRHGNQITVRDVVALAVAGDHGCRRVVADAGRALGVAIAGACNLLAPEVVVVGGELAAAGDALLEPLRDSVARSALGAVRDVPVVAGALGQHAELRGALALVLHEAEHFAA